MSKIISTLRAAVTCLALTVAVIIAGPAAPGLAQDSTSLQPFSTGYIAPYASYAANAGAVQASGIQGLSNCGGGQAATIVSGSFGCTSSIASASTATTAGSATYAANAGTASYATTSAGASVVCTNGYVAATDTAGHWTCVNSISGNAATATTADGANIQCTNGYVAATDTAGHWTCVNSISGNAGSAGYANQAGSANTANSAGYANSAGTANTAGSAGYANQAGSADTANSAGYASNAGYANSAGTANSATYAANAGTSNGASIQCASGYVATTDAAGRWVCTNNISGSASTITTPFSSGNMSGIFQGKLILSQGYAQITQGTWKNTSDGPAIAYITGGIYSASSCGIEAFINGVFAGGNINDNTHIGYSGGKSCAITVAIPSGGTLTFDTPPTGIATTNGSPGQSSYYNLTVFE